MRRQRTLTLIAVIFLAVSLMGNILLITYVEKHPRTPLPIKQAVPSYDDDQLVVDITTYLDQISPKFTDEVEKMAAEKHLPSWGCGPSSYALAKMLNKKFFNDRLRIVPSYENHPYEIVERFGLADDNPSLSRTNVIDHAWVEIYLKDRFIFIDPTVGQFGKYKTIVHEVFKVGDPAIEKTLLEKYGVLDVRLRLLVQKAANRVPDSQQPYPGLGVRTDSLAYYQQIVGYRAEIEIGNEPDDWKEWTAALLKNFEPGAST